MRLNDIAHQSIIIPLCQLKHDDTWFYDIQLINNMEETLKSIKDTDTKLDIDEMRRIILEEKLFFYQKHYCNKCEHSDKDLQWHQKRNTEIAWVYNIQKCAYIFICNNMKK